VETKSVHLSVTWHKWLNCCIFIAVLIDVIYKKLSRMSLEFCGNLVSGSHALLQEIAELNVYCPYIMRFRWNLAKEIHAECRSKIVSLMKTGAVILF
jgi:hypothetical protein